MFYPNYKELTFSVPVVKRDDRYVPDLPDLSYGLVLCFVGGINYYAYPLPESTLGKQCLCHIVYKAEDNAVMQAAQGKLGKGNEVCKTAEYKAVVKLTVADVKIAEEKARLTAEAEAKGEVVKQADLDAVKYTALDKDDGVPAWVFQNKDYVDK